MEFKKIIEENLPKNILIGIEYISHGQKKTSYANLPLSTPTYTIWPLPRLELKHIIIQIKGKNQKCSFKVP